MLSLFMLSLAIFLFPEWGRLWSTKKKHFQKLNLLELGFYQPFALGFLVNLYQFHLFRLLSFSNWSIIISSMDIIKVEISLD